MTSGMSKRERFNYFVKQTQELENAEDVIGVYDRWLDTYEDDVMSPEINSYGRNHLVASLKKQVPDKSVKIIDFLAGTGTLGELVHEAGFKNIDGIDGSAKSIEVARKKNIYQNLIVEYIKDDHVNISDDVYDVLVMNGGFAFNHMSASIFPEWIRIIKPGGYIFNVFRNRRMSIDPRFKDGKLEADMQKYEDGGKWKLVEKTITKGGTVFMDTILFVHQIC